MRIVNRVEKLNLKDPVATIGVFDGVHLGHQQIIKRVNDYSESLGGESVVITLWPHPKMVLSKNHQQLQLLTTLDEKKILLESAGIDLLIIIPFTTLFAQLDSEDFTRKYLLANLGIRHLVLGHDHHFGKGRSGNYESMKKLAEKYDFGIEKMDAVYSGGHPVSSTLIRHALLEGNVTQANRLLGYRYFIEGIVGHGNRIGSEIGFPTANMNVINPYKIIPRDGVYAVLVAWEGKYYKAMLNIGYRPTIDERNKKKILEVHVFDFGKNLYNERLMIFFADRLRDEVKFDSLQDLKTQLMEDKKQALEALDALSMDNPQFWIRM